MPSSSRLACGKTVSRKKLCRDGEFVIPLHLSIEMFNGCITVIGEGFKHGEYSLGLERKMRHGKCERSRGRDGSFLCFGLT